MVSPLAWSLYFAIPVRGWGLANGLPLGPLEAGAIAFVWWVWEQGRHVPGRRTLIALVLAKVVLGALIVEGGFAARYYANDTWSAPLEQSVEFRSRDITRRDERLAFGGDGQPDLPLFFFNDIRFNYYQPTEPKRDLLPYSIAWEGFLQTSEPSQPVTFYLAAGPNMTGGLAVDDVPVISLDSAQERTGAISLTSGWHRVTVRVAASDGSGRRVEAGEIVDNLRYPFDSRRISAEPVGLLRHRIVTPLQWIAGGMNFLVFSWLGLLVLMRLRAAWRASAIGRLLWFLIIVEAILFALPHARHVVRLSGGDDWLTYEWMARLIGLGDLLLRVGAAPGDGSPFYYQPLYPYFIALTHLVFGDSLFGAVFIQRLLVAVTAVMVGSITTRLFGPATGWVALIGGGVFMYAKAGRWANILLSEPLFIPLFVGWVWLLVRTATGTITTTKLLAAGIAGGLATLARSTLLLAWPLLVPAWSLSLPNKRVRRTLLLVTIMIAVIGTATLRNWVVARAFVPIASSGGINLFLGNTPPQPLPAPPTARTAIYDRLNVSNYMRVVLEYALQTPGAFMRNLGNKALYSMGFFERSGIQGGATGASWFYAGMWLAALCGVVRLLRSPPRHPWVLMALPGLAALSHFMAVVLIFPHVYVDRLILPLYPLLIPYAAYAAEPVVSWARLHPARAASYSLVALAVGVMLPASPRSLDVVTVLILLVAALTLVTGPWPRFHTRAWIYFAYAAPILLAYARARWSGDFGRLDFVGGLLLPVAVFAIARLARQPAVYRATLATFIVAAVVGLAVVQPPLPEIPNEIDEIVDIGRDAQNILRGNPDAWQDLRDDAVAVWRSVTRPAGEALGTLTQRIGVFGVICLFGIWVQALATTYRDAIRGRCALSAVCFALLLMAFLLGIVGIAPNRWQAGGYSVATLAVLFGLAEARLGHADSERNTATAAAP